MKELIEEFRLLGLAGHQHHRTPGWKDCTYEFCRRRHQLWANAAVIGMRTRAAVEVSDPPISVDRVYKLGHEHGMAAARELLTMETSAAPGVMLPRAGKLLSDLFPDGIHVGMRGDQITYVGGGPAICGLKCHECQPPCVCLRLRGEHSCDFICERKEKG